MSATSQKLIYVHFKSRKLEGVVTSSRLELTSCRTLVSLKTAQSLFRSNDTFLVDLAHNASPSKIAEGNTSYEPTKAKHAMYFNVNKSLEVLGLKYHTLEECAIDSVKDFETRGWL